MTTIPLHGHLLALDDDGRTVRLIGPDAGVAIEIRIDERGPVLRLGSGARLELAGTLDIDAQRLRLHGRESVEITSGVSVAIEGQRGDVALTAHDDVRLDGTRIRNNC